jgi:hypothetical protein
MAGWIIQTNYTIYNDKASLKNTSERLLKLNGTGTLRATARNSDHNHGTVTPAHTPPKPKHFNTTATRSDKLFLPSRATKRIRSSLNNGDLVAPLLFSRFHGGLLPAKLARTGSPPCTALANHSSILSSFMVFAEDHIRPGRSIANPTTSGLRLGCLVRPAWKMCAFIPLATIQTGASEKIASSTSMTLEEAFWAR